MEAQGTVTPFDSIYSDLAWHPRGSALCCVTFSWRITPGHGRSSLLFQIATAISDTKRTERGGKLTFFFSLSVFLFSAFALGCPCERRASTGGRVARCEIGRARMREQLLHRGGRKIHFFPRIAKVFLQEEESRHKMSTDNA